MSRGKRGAYRKEDRVALPPELQKELVEKAAAKYGNCQELARALELPKSSVHYYRIGRLTMPESLLERMLQIANDPRLTERVDGLGTTKDRLWAIEQAKSVYIATCQDRVRQPSKADLSEDIDLRRKTAAVVSYVLAEGSIWMSKEKWGEHAVNITFAEHETDLYDHFRGLCRDVFHYDIGPPKQPGNNARAIRGFIYSRYVAEALIELGVPVGDKACKGSHLPDWVMESEDKETWVSALQPICDGEGCVRISFRQGLQGFQVTQTRHTDLDLGSLSTSQIPGRSSRNLSCGELRERSVFGVPVLDYCSMTARSGLMDDSRILMRRLGLRPRIGILTLHLKDDGFWSATWGVNLPRTDARTILDEGLVTQSLKRYGLSLFAD